MAEEGILVKHFTAEELTREDLIEIIRNIPDTVVAYDRNGQRMVYSDIVDQHGQKRAEADAETLAQIKESEKEMAYAIRNVILWSFYS